MDLFKVL